MDIRYGVLNNYIRKDGKGKFFYDWDYIMTIPEFQTLMATEQSDKWHKEGNAWVHTGLVCEAALSMLDNRDFNEEDSVVFLASALFHDIGKGACTKTGKDGKPHSYGHEVIGSRITRFVLWDMDISLREKICLLVKYHMEPLVAFTHKDYLSHIMRIVSSGVDFTLLSDLKRCDNKGSIMFDGYNRRDDEGKIDFFEECCRSLSSLDKYMGRDGVLPWQWEKDPIFCNQAIMMVGIAGSGKDTFISRYLSGDQYVKISRDDIRTGLGIADEGEKTVGSDEEERKVTENVRKMMNDALNNRDIPIIDATNLSSKRRRDVKNLVSAKDWSGAPRDRIQWRYIYIEPETKDEAFERNLGRVKDNVVEGMMKGLELPEKCEYDEFEAYKSNGNNFTRVI